MTRRHYGIRVPKPRPTYTGPARAGAWSGSAFISVIVVILIVLGVILYGLSKTITASRTSSIPTRARSSLARPSPACSPPTALRSAWTVKGLGGTTCDRDGEHDPSYRVVPHQVVTTASDDRPSNCIPTATRPLLIGQLQTQLAASTRLRLT